LVFVPRARSGGQASSSLQNANLNVGATSCDNTHQLSPPISISPLPSHLAQSPLPPHEEQKTSPPSPLEKLTPADLPVPPQAEQFPSPGDSQSMQT